jgi:membrane protein implicated in regulation of membrane protease activity
MNKRTAMLAAAAAGLAFSAGPALAYIGPGAGLSLLGALWGVLAAVFAVFAFLLLWPLRRLLRRRKAKTEVRRPNGRDDAPEVAGAARHHR